MVNLPLWCISSGGQLTFDDTSIKQLQMIYLVEQMKNNSCQMFAIIATLDSMKCQEHRVVLETTILEPWHPVASHCQKQVSRLVQSDICHKGHLSKCELETLVSQ